jgi:hypothetical protein
MCVRVCVCVCVFVCVCVYVGEGQKVLGVDLKTLRRFLSMSICTYTRRV